MPVKYPNRHLPQNTNDFENEPGLKEDVDPELTQVFQQIKRGDLGMPSHALKAAAYQYAVHCNQPNQEYMLCKKEELDDPRQCLKYSNAVSDCASQFYKKVADTCSDSFVTMAKCMETSIGRSFSACRVEQVSLDRCLFDKLGYDKAYYPIPRDQEITTERPKPKNPLQIKKYNYPMPIAPDFSRPFPNSN